MRQSLVAYWLLATVSIGIYRYFLNVVFGRRLELFLVVDQPVDEVLLHGGEWLDAAATAQAGTPIRSGSARRRR